jgi:enoyl-CoA hydratase
MHATESLSAAVSSQRLGAITLITLSRPDVRNAVDADTARALYAAFIVFEEDADAKVAVFHGAHGHFCAGWDLKAGARMARDEGGPGVLTHLDFEPLSGAQLEAAPASAPLGPMGPSRLLLSKPVIAAVSGAAVAGGMELALWCDMRVMEEDAYFGVFCRRFGVPLIDGGTVRLPRLIGMGHAMDLLLTGRKVQAAEALAMGLANRVVPTGGALDAALALAEQLAGFPQATMNADRMSAYQQSDLPLHQALHQEWLRGKACIGEGLEGAGRFSDGQGRHGSFGG